MNRFDDISLLFTSLFIVFIVLVVAERVWKTFFFNKVRFPMAAKGTIYFQWTYPLLLISYLLAICFGISEYFAINRAINIYVTLVGALVCIAALVLRNASISSLGDLWSVHIKMPASFNIISSGPYAQIRHPYYLASVLELLGFSLIPNSFYSMTFVLVVHLPLVIYRAYLEEGVLLLYSKGLYDKYKMLTPALYPRYIQRHRG